MRRLVDIPIGQLPLETAASLQAGGGGYTGQFIGQINRIQAGPGVNREWEILRIVNVPISVPSVGAGTDFTLDLFAGTALVWSQTQRFTLPTSGAIPSVIFSDELVNPAMVREGEDISLRISALVVDGPGWTSPPFIEINAYYDKPPTPRNGGNGALIVTERKSGSADSY